MAERKQTYQERRMEALNEMSQRKDPQTGTVTVCYAGSVIGEYPSHYHAVKYGPDAVLEFVKAKTSKTFNH
jgi:hypothetical protein